MGAVAALEVARRLVADGHAPRCLIVSGCSAPHIPSKRDRPLHTLSRDELLKELIRLEGLPALALERTDYIDTFLPTIRADMQCREEWLSHPYEFSVPIHALGGTDDKFVSQEDLLSWKNYTSSTFAMKTFTGGHFFIKTAEDDLLRHVSEVTAQYCCPDPYAA
jgi:surfactin synthase thioesterase subunit